MWMQLANLSRPLYICTEMVAGPPQSCRFASEGGCQTQPDGGQRQPCGCSGSWKSWKTRVQHVPALEVQAARMPLLRLFGWKHCSVVVQVIWLSWVRVYYTKTSCEEGTEDEFQTLTLDNKQNPLLFPCFREEGEGSSFTKGWMQAVDQAETWHQRAICHHCHLFPMQ